MDKMLEAGGFAGKLQIKKNTALRWERVHSALSYEITRLRQLAS